MSSKARHYDGLIKLLRSKSLGEIMTDVYVNGRFTGNVEDGREFVKAYVTFIHYVERVYLAAQPPAVGHEHGTPEENPRGCAGFQGGGSHHRLPAGDGVDGAADHCGGIRQSSPR